MTKDMIDAIRFASDLAGEAFRCFDRWWTEHDPEGEMDVLEAAAAYSAWADTNSIEKYLDAAVRAGQLSKTPTACRVSALSTSSLHQFPPKSNQSEG